MAPARAPPLSRSSVERTPHESIYCVGFSLIFLGAPVANKRRRRRRRRRLPAIPVAHPVQRSVTDYVEYTGTLNAQAPVRIQPQVTGVLKKPIFKEGSYVKAGDLLFEIDPVIFQAQLEVAKATLKGNEAALEQAKEQLKIDEQLVGGGAVSKLTVEKDKAALDEAKARIDAAKANIKINETMLGYTMIKSPIAGLVSRYDYTEGNIVIQNSTLLTTIVPMDPIYVYFDMDSRTFQRYLQLINNKKIKLPQDTADAESEKLKKTEQPSTPGNLEKSAGVIPDSKVLMATEGEKGFPHEGLIDFMNNQVSASTGTISVRGVFSNPQPKGGTWRFYPGMFVRVNLPLGEPKPSLLVIERAIGSDQGLKFVYVAETKPNKEGVQETRAQYRRVVTGARQTDGLIVIEDFKETVDEKTKEVTKSGVKADEWIIVGGLPQVKAKTLITPVPQEMPLAASDAPTAIRDKAQPPPPSGKSKK